MKLSEVLLQLAVAAIKIRSSYFLMILRIVDFVTLCSHFSKFSRYYFQKSTDDKTTKVPEECCRFKLNSPGDKTRLYGKSTYFQVAVYVKTKKKYVCKMSVKDYLLLSHAEMDCSSVDNGMIFQHTLLFKSSNGNYKRTWTKKYETIYVVRVLV